MVSSSDPPADVSAAVAQAGIRMPVLVDEGDALYERLGIRLHPMVGIADAKLVLLALEPYRQIEYCDVIKTRIRILIGEADQAALDKVLNPEKSPLPGADLAKKAMRDVNMARRLYEIGQYAESVKFAQRAVGVFGGVFRRRRERSAGKAEKIAARAGDGGEGQSLVAAIVARQLFETMIATSRVQRVGHEHGVVDRRVQSNLCETLHRRKGWTRPADPEREFDSVD